MNRHEKAGTGLCAVAMCSITNLSPNDPAARKLPNFPERLAVPWPPIDIDVRADDSSPVCESGHFKL
jgi:hypothetical protein